MTPSLRSGSYINVREINDEEKADCEEEEKVEEEEVDDETRQCYDERRQHYHNHIDDCNITIKDAKSKRDSMKRQLSTMENNMVCKRMAPIRFQFITFILLENERFYKYEIDKAVHGVCFDCSENEVKSNVSYNAAYDVMFCCADEKCKVSFFMCTTCANVKDYNKIIETKCICDYKLGLVKLECPEKGCNCDIYLSFGYKNKGSWDVSNEMVFITECKHDMYPYSKSVFNKVNNLARHIEI